MKKLLLIASAVLLLSPLSLFAQDDEEPPAPLADVWIMVPKQGMGAQFEAAIAAHMAFRAEAEDSRAWNVYRTVAGHNMDGIQFRACCFNWADQDDYLAEEQEKGFNQNWNENVHQHVDHYHHYFERADWDNSHWPEGSGNGPYFGVTSWPLKSGTGPGPNAAREKLSEIALNEGWSEAGNTWLWFTREIGKPMLSIVTSYSSFADMEPPETSFFEFVSEHLGAEKAGALFAEFSSNFESSDYTIWMRAPELSSPGGDEE